MRCLAKKVDCCELGICIVKTYNWYWREELKDKRGAKTILHNQAIPKQPHQW